MSPLMRERPLTGSTCFKSPGIASKKSTQRPGEYSPRFPRPAPVARGSRGPRGCCGLDSIRTRKIHQIDPQTGAIVRTIQSNRFVTGVTWVDGELWHGTWEGDESDLRRIDPRNGEVLESIEMPAGVNVSGLESDGANLFFCGGGSSGKVRSVRRPKRRTMRS